MWPIRDDVITEDHILAEIGELVSGDQLGRAADNDTTLYKSVGLGVQDAAAAELVYRAALNKNIGVEVDF
jgi:ornithine cyclodeaminase/alanine dehydrogenase-like protein (mu-crystallin family)